MEKKLYYFRRFSILSLTVIVFFSIVLYMIATDSLKKELLVMAEHRSVRIAHQIMDLLHKSIVTPENESGSAFNGFRAAVHEKGFRREGELYQLPGQKALRDRVKKVRRVHKLCGLFGYRLFYYFRRVAQRVYRKAAYEIEVLFAAGIDRDCAFSADDSERKAPVVRCAVFFIKRENFLIFHFDIVHHFMPLPKRWAHPMSQVCTPVEIWHGVVRKAEPYATIIVATPLPVAWVLHF